MDTKIKEIKGNSKGRLISLRALVDKIVQTSGPTLFNVTDGTGTLTLKGFDGPGVRAYPQIEEGHAIEATIEIREFNNAIEGEIMKIRRLDTPAHNKLKADIETMQKEQAQAKPMSFIAKTPILEKLKDRFVKAATEIRLAVITNRPIIIRHHNDCDGYSSGYVMEKAILPLIEEQHGTEKAPWQYFSRAPSMTPFYEIEDSIKDSSKALTGNAKFSEKMPLVIIVDNGSGPENLLSIKQGKVHGIDFIVVDHHAPEKDLISDEVLVHINPFLVEEDGDKISAGMLCAELARFVAQKEIESIDYIPALSGLSDRINNPQVMEAYMAVAHKKGYTKQLLEDISAVVEFVSSKLRFMEAREYVSTVFGEQVERQKKLVSVLSPYIKKLQEKGLAIAKHLVKKEKLGLVVLQTLDVESSFSRNAYPKPGQTIGMIHDDYLNEHKNARLVSIASLSDVIVIRASEESNFSVNEFIAHLNKICPEAFIEGGGHKQAGAIKFVPAKQKEVLDALKKFLEKL